MPAGAAIKVGGINVFYGDFHALWDISLEVGRGEIVSIIGSNGSGKSTLLNALAGQLTPRTGSISYFGESIGGLPPHETVARGMALVPEGRRVFPRLTVFENLFMGSYTSKARKNREGRKMKTRATKGEERLCEQEENKGNEKTLPFSCGLTCQPNQA